MILPGRFNETDDDLTVGLDSSGSMSDEDIARVLAVIYHYAAGKNLKVRVIECADFIGQDITVPAAKLPKVWKRKVSGGTSFEPVFRRLAEGKRRPKLTVYLTDGYADFSWQPQWPVVWVITHGGIDRAPWGTTVKLGRDAV